MAVSYGGLSLNPVENLSINQTSDFAENGRLKRYLFSISVSGKIIADRNLSINAKHNQIKAKAQAILAAFKNVDSTSNTFFDIQSNSGSSPPIKFIPRVRSVKIEEGIWVEYANYSLELEADEIFIGSTKIPVENLSEHILEKDDNWSINYSDEDTKFITVNHTIFAKAKDTISKKGWQISKNFVTQQLNLFGNFIPSDIDSATGEYINTKPLVNKKIKYDVSILEGSASAEVELTFHRPLSNPSQSNLASHEQTVTINETRETLIATKTIEGTITGLLNISNNESTGLHRYNNASYLWNFIKNQIEIDNSGYSLSNKNLTFDKIKGIINYTYEYGLVSKNPNVKSENITITDGEGVNVVVVHDAINLNGDGPIFQNLNTKKVKTRTVNIDIVSPTYIIPETSIYIPSVNAILESDSIQHSPNTGKISRTTSWVWV